MDSRCVFSIAWAEFDLKVCPTITKTLATPLLQILYNLRTEYHA